MLAIMAVETLKPNFVGGLACQRDSFLSKGFKTTVLSCESSGKKNVYQVELQDTILFPEGGGQPSDTGELILGEAGRAIPVSQVTRKGLHAIHYVSEFVEPGTEVSVSVDWEQRMDYMQQHTGQHLVSAILEREWDLQTLSWSMGGVPTDKKKTIELTDLFNYIELARKLTDNEIDRLSTFCNEYITKMPKEITVLERTPETHGEVNTSKIPDDYDLSAGILRTIHIGEIDSNPCCGTHLKSTTQLGSILFSPAQSSVRGTNSRLYFMCGSRVAKYGKFAQGLLNRTKGILSCSEAQVPDKVEIQRDAIQKTTKREQYWMKVAASYEATRLFNSVKQNQKGFVAQDEFGGLDFLNQVYKDFNKSVSESGIKDYIVVLCGREKQPNNGAVMVLSDSGETIASTVSKLTEIIPKLRGGGGKKGGKWQGKVAEYGKNEWKSLTTYLEVGL